MHTDTIGWRVHFRAEPLSVEVEGPLESGWCLGLLLYPYRETLVIGELKVFPDGDRKRAARGEILDYRYAPRMWSEDPSALDPESPEITARLLRHITSLDWIKSLVREHWASDLGRKERTEWEQVLGARPGDVAGEFASAIDLERPRMGRPSRSNAPRRDLELARLAQSYDRAVNVSRSRSPIKDIAAELGISTAAVRDAKFRAVEKGFLVGTQPRKAAGFLSPKAAHLLDQAKQAEDAQ